MDKLFPVYAVVECPHCKRVQVKEIRRKRKLDEIKFKCTLCKKSFKACYKRNRNKTIIKVFLNPNDAKNFIIGLKYKVKSSI